MVAYSQQHEHLIAVNLFTCPLSVISVGLGATYMVNVLSGTQCFESAVLTAVKHIL